MKIRSLGAELFYVDGRTDRLDEANSRFSELLLPPKNKLNALKNGANRFLKTYLFLIFTTCFG